MPPTAELSIPATSEDRHGQAAVCRWQRWHLWCLGFFLTANVYLVPNFSSSPRATDLISFLLSLWVIYRLASSGLRRAPLLALLLFNLLPCGWFAYALLTGDQQTLLLSGRWLLAIPWGLTLLFTLQESSALRAFLKGMMWGLLINIAIIFLQVGGFDSALRASGFSTADTDFSQRVYRTVRFPGLHGHHNASAAVISLIVPVSLALYFRFKVTVWLPLCSIGLLFLAAHLTSTRSPLLVAGLTFLLVLACVKMPRRALLLLALVSLLSIVFFAVVGPPGGKLRWADLVSTEENVGGRVTSSLSALRLSLEHPQGHGVSVGRQQLIAASAIPATHNAFLQASLFFGLLPAIAMLWAFIYLCWRMLHGARNTAFWAGVFALHLGCLFFFEEHLNNATFMILTNWLIATSAALLAGDLKETARHSSVLEPSTARP